MNILEYENYHEAKLHTNAAFPYNTYLCSIPLDFSHVPVHWHEEMELIVIKKGRGVVEVELESKVVVAGELVIVLPGQLHAIRQEQPYTMEYENIIFHPDMLKSSQPDLCTSEYFLPLLNRQVICPVWITKDCPLSSGLNSCIGQIDLACGCRPKAYHLAIKAYLFQFFYLLLQHCQKTSQANPGAVKALDKIKMILKKIETDYAENLTIADMAELAGYSQSHFMKFFKKNMRVSFIEYLNEYRLTMAARLLLVSSEDILTIAIETGFSNISYFNRLFKKKYGMTPGIYRKNRLKA